MASLDESRQAECHVVGESGTVVSEEPRTPGTLLVVRGEDPHPFFGRLRQDCPVGFDEGTESWLVSSYEGCRQVLTADTEQFHHIDQATDPFVVELSGGARQLKFLYGDEHHRMHLWWLRAFSPKSVAALQEPIIRPIVDAAIDRFIEAGQAELWAELASRIPVRAIAAVMGLPYDDDDWVETIAHHMDILARLFDQRFNADDSTKEDARTASKKMTDMMIPAIRARRDGTGGDMISRLWADGPDLLEDWSEEDVVTNLHNMFVGGKDTTTLAIANALYLLLRDNGLSSSLKEDEGNIETFVEESLRLEAPVQFRVRVAVEDVDIEGVHIEAGSKVVPIIASAGRDPKKWGSDVDGVELDRSVARTHMAFLYGPRTCVGAALARAEIQESIRAVLRRLPDLRLDPAQPQPAYPGMTLRAHHPLHVRFTPGARLAQSVGR